MKILHVEAGRHLYGGALQVAFLLRGLREHGVDSVLACPTGSAIAQAAALHARVVPLKMGGDADLGMLVRLRRLIRAERPDLVHLHSRRGSDLWGALAARLEGVPVVLSRRVDNPEPRWLVRIKYRLYDRVVTISDGIRQVLRSEGVPEAQLRCVPSAVDTTHYRPADDRAAARRWLAETFDLPAMGPGGPAVGPVIGMAAQFIARKGHAVLLDALPRVIAAHPGLRVLLFGQGPLHAELSARVQADATLRGHVRLPGFRTDLDRVLPALDLLVHPAFMEGLGVTLLQAAACGLPIVAGRAGGIPEVVRPGVNGELVEPGDVNALADALLALLGSAEQRARYGAAGRQWVEARFSVPAMVAGNLAVYRELVAVSPPTAA